MKTFILTVLVMIASVSVSFSAHAGPRIVGNGGIAVEIDGKLYMLDLFERSVHKKPYFIPDTTPLREVQDRMEKTFAKTNMENVPMERLVQKLSEVYNKSYLLGWYFENAITRLDWRLVDSTLVPSEDARTPIDDLRLKQVAVRVNNVVYVSEAMWNKLDDNNKVALILHEAAYFFVPPQSVTNGSERYSFQHAAKARSVTGLVFTKRFAIEGLTEENADVFIPNVTNAPKLDANKFGISFGLSFQMGLKDDGNPSFNEMVELPRMENLEQILTAYAAKECTRLAANLTKEERARSAVPFKVYIRMDLVTASADLQAYDLKNGDTQKYLSVSLSSNDNAYYGFNGVIATKNVAASCLETTNYSLRSFLSKFKYKIK